MNRACEETSGVLDAFVGGDLDAAGAARVAAHLRDCAWCRRQAGSLQQALRQLGSLRDLGHHGVDESMFTAMHRATMARIDAEVGKATGRLVRLRRMLPIAAAVGLFAIGWWLTRDPAPPSVFVRTPIGVPVGLRSEGGAAASAVPLRLLGVDAPAPAPDGLGSGLMGRWRLRTLEGSDTEPWFGSRPGGDGPAGGSAGPKR